jgi:hypothetical protein
MGGKAGAGGSGGGVGMAFAKVAQILETNCGSSCHKGEVENRINLSGKDPGALYTRLTTPLDVDLCFGKALVTAGQAASSLLVRVVKSELTDPCVVPRMPAGCADSKSCLRDADIMTIEAWIADGAKRN